MSEGEEAVSDGVESTVADDLQSAIAERVGEALRGVVAYDHGEIDVHHLRESVDAGTDARAAKHDVLHRITAQSFPADHSPFGAHRLSIHCFDSVTAIHVRAGARRGVVASLDTDSVDDVDIGELLDAVRSSMGDR